jgi:hypothetical protein
MDRTGSGDLENALLVLCDGSRLSRSRSGLDVLSGHPLLDFKRLSHVAANLQSLFVRAGNVICFSFANEQ